MWSGIARMDCGGSPFWVKAFKGALFVELKIKTKLIKSQFALTFRRMPLKKDVPPNTLKITFRFWHSFSLYFYEY